MKSILKYLNKKVFTKDYMTTDIVEWQNMYILPNVKVYWRWKRYWNKIYIKTPKEYKQNWLKIIVDKLWLKQ